CFVTWHELHRGLFSATRITPVAPLQGRSKGSISNRFQSFNPPLIHTPPAAEVRSSSNPLRLKRIQQFVEQIQRWGAAETIRRLGG
ncbi:MAG TPA: hypothetical protein VFS20_02485, partial [Longimicrobium sp.]|nr:hypothetical protein [Longimicrobium sp.]